MNVFASPNVFTSPIRHGLSVAGVYAVVGALWIAFSDRLVASLTDDARLLTHLQTIKGWAFVALSALLIAILVRQAIKREAAVLLALRRSEERFRSFFDQAAVGLAEVDLTGHWTMVNHQLCQMLGYEADELLRLTSLDITPSDQHEAERQSMRRLLDGEILACSREKRYLRKDGTLLWVLLSANLVRDHETGQPRFFIAIIQEIEARKRAEAGLQAALEEKEVLLAEINHRVRNNLQLVVSLLSMEAVKFQDPQVRAAFDSTLARIEAMGLIHQQLYQSQDFSEVSFDLYVRALCQALVAAIAPTTVAFRYELAAVRCSLDLAVPMGMILVELVVDALKHAFPDERRGTILVRLVAKQSRFRMDVIDDGIGRPPEQAQEGTGMTIVRMLTQQLGGQLDASPVHGGGTLVRLEFALR